MDLNLKNKVVLISGSSRGIGRAIAETFLREQASVVISGRDQKVLDQTQSEFKASYPQRSLISFCGDLTDPSQIKKCLELVISKFKRIDILVTNIGSGKVEPNQSKQVQKKMMMKLNYDSVVALIDAVVPYFRRQQGAKAIVSIASVAGIKDIGAPAAYAQAKSKLIEYCLRQSVLLAENQIRINCVSPGNIYFPGGRWEELKAQDPKGVAQMLKKKIPLQRFGTPMEIAEAVVFLASEKSAFTSGSNWVIDGGQLAAQGVTK